MSGIEIRTERCPWPAWRGDVTVVAAVGEIIVCQETVPGRDSYYPSGIGGYGDTAPLPPEQVHIEAARERVLARAREKLREAS